ncbi:ATP-dependent helicase [Thermus filiformis]|uniref:ATP-dependent helicase n=1 Tax=Thermus filiformis TaxID=276 RepID=UPI000530C371|nr:UvrD-helicase domain-containing protein [Thermus filiformis]
MDDLLAPLNEAQRQAVLHFEGPALVVAGAGSGKTRTVVHRVAYLLRHRGVYPTEVLAVTFTNKAANELKERLLHLVGPAAREIWAATFHSAALRILRAYGERLGLKPGFVVYGEDDQEALLRELLKEMGLEARPGPIKAFLDRAKNSGKSLEAFLREAPEYIAGLPKERLAPLLYRYQEALRAQGAVDFGDILLLALELLEGHPEVLEKVRQRARFIHVDEYQDTNPVQYRFVRLLASPDAPNLVAVGDPDQSIYGFRAADIRNILDFTRDFPGARIYRLEENYRSTEAILRLANAVIAQNQARLEKTLRPRKKGGEPVRLYRAATAREEAQFVAQEVARLGPPYDRYAVLYRTNAQSRLLEEALRFAGIPAQVVGGVGFFERAEVKDLLAYARLAVNPLDALAFQRAVKTPPRGLGQATLERVRALDLPPLEALKALPLKGAQARAKEAFLALMEELFVLAEGPAEAFFRHLLAATDYLAYLKEAYPDHEDRRENVEELLRAAEEAGSVQEFLDRVALTASADQAEGAEPQGQVRLMTLHNAKGLEFPVVFLVGLEENLLPHRNSLSRLEDLEEERRLFYVGLTRAQERLYLSYALEREVYGRREHTRMSRFLEELPPGLYELYEPNAHTRPAPSPQPPGPRPSEGGFKGGEKVYHPKFGPGRVVAARGEEVTVHFEGVGLKKLHLRFADLLLLRQENTERPL